MSFLVDMTRNDTLQAIVDLNALYGYPRYSKDALTDADVILMTSICTAFQSNVDTSKYGITLRSATRMELRRAVNAGSIDVPTAQRLDGYFDAAVEELPPEYVD